MQKLSARQRTLAGKLEFSGYGVHSALPVTLTIEPAAADSGFLIARQLDNGTLAGPVQVHFSRVTRTTLCTTLDLGDSVSVATIEHVISALSGLGVDNARITLTGAECPILDGSAAPFLSAIRDAGAVENGAGTSPAMLSAPRLLRGDDGSMIIGFPARAFHATVVLDYPNHAVRIWLLAGGAKAEPLSHIYAVDWQAAWRSFVQQQVKFDSAYRHTGNAQPRARPPDV